MLLLRLRLRSWFLGWGLHPEELRVLSAYSQHAFWVCLQGAILLEAIIPVASFIQYRSVDFASAARVMAVPQVFILGFALSYLARSLIYRRRVREATLVPEHLVGYCYRVVLNPSSSCFIRFGVTAGTARWYAAPLEWEELISTAPPETPFELWVLPVAGWVERLRRGGAEPREVTQPGLEPQAARSTAVEGVPRDDGGGEAGEDEGATRAEARAMRRYARHAGLMWLATPRQILGSWICFLVLVPLICVVAVALVAWIVTLPPRQMPPGSERPFIIMTLILLGLIELCVIAAGIWPFAAWLRERRLDDTQAQMTGEVVAWMGYRNWYVPASFSHQDQRREKLIKLRTADGGEQIFRLPPLLAHRIEDRGDLVRITYRTATGQVLDVRHVEAPVEAVAADHQDP